MGWNGDFSSLKEIKEHLNNHLGDRKILDEAATNYGRNLWRLYETVEGERYICLYLIQKHEGALLYKDISESMGPLEVDCPLRFLERAPQPEGEFAAEWRQKVQEYHQNKKESQKAQFEVGSEVTIYGKQYRVMGKIKRSYAVQSLETGKVYRCGPTKMKASPKIS